MALRHTSPRSVQALTGLIVMVLVLGAAGLGIYAANGAFADDYQIRAITERAGFGLDSTSDVKVRGITVGNVERIDLQDDGAVELVMNIRKEIRIPDSATASIEPASVFGPKFVDLSLGPDEGEGPYLDDGGQLTELVAPTELGETLDSVSTLLDRLDEERIGTILSELARASDGLGDELGETFDATVEFSDTFLDLQPALRDLVTDANAVTGTLSERTGQIVSLATDGQDLLRLLAEEGDAIGEVLVATSELSQRLDDVVSEAAGDLDAVIAGLGPAARVLHDHVAQLPDFTAAFRDVVQTLGDTALQWNIGDGRLGAVLRAVTSLDPCDLFPNTLPICPPAAGS